MPGGEDVGLVPLVLPDPRLHALDVVFIHGLNGHRTQSWTNNASELWPLWLREDLSGTRAWSYGYDAGIAIGSRDDIGVHSISLLSALVEKGVGKTVCLAISFVLYRSSRERVVLIDYMLTEILIRHALINQTH